MTLKQSPSAGANSRTDTAAGVARWGRRGAVGAVIGATALVGLAAPSQAAYSNTPTPTWGANGVVLTMASRGNVTYLGGDFTKLVNPATGASVPARHIAAINRTTGRPVKGFSASANESVQALALSPGGRRLYVGGDFSRLNGGQARHLAAISPVSGARIRSFAASVSGNVLDIIAGKNSIYIGGQFQLVDNAPRLKLAKLVASNGAVVSGWHPSVTGGVYALTTLAHRRGLVVVGRFSHINSQERRNVGAVNLDTGAPLAWHPQLFCNKGCPVFDVTASPRTVFVAIGGQGGTVTALNARTAKKRWADHADGDIQAVLYSGDDSRLYVGGHFDNHFTSVSGSVVRHQLAVVNPLTGATYGHFRPAFTRQFPGVLALLALPNNLLVGGGFSGVAGHSQPRYAQFRNQ